jgi:hypothetical protein
MLAKSVSRGIGAGRREGERDHAPDAAAGTGACSSAVTG